ncbi:MAG: alanyl-tRNA editing protein [Pyrinomonadaceae bacterium]
MSITERLYYTDSHLTEFAARVADITRTADGRAAMVLDRTAFYPTGGGQPSDTGTLDAMRVVECVEDEDAGVLHVVEGDSPPVGASITGRVDWARRFDHLQQHTAQHILSQALIKLFDAETRGFRMMEQASEIDVALRDPTNERIIEAVGFANQIVWSNLAVRAHNNVSPEAAALMNLRKASAREGLLRIIEIEGFDTNACGGTHAQATGEVGIICVRSWERAKGMTRLEFVAGGRALRDYNEVNTAARKLAAQFSVGRDDTAAAVSRLSEDHKTLQRRVAELETLEARVTADDLRASTVRQADGTLIIARVVEAHGVEQLKRLAHALTDSERTIALLGSIENGTARLVFARSIDAGADMNALMREACANIEGRGGGLADFAQGGGKRTDKLALTLEVLARGLSENRATQQG